MPFFHCESLIHSFIQQIFLEQLLMPDSGCRRYGSYKVKNKVLVKFIFWGRMQTVEETYIILGHFGSWQMNKNEA